MDYVVLNENSNYGKIAIHKAVFQSIVQQSLKDIENGSLMEKETFNKKPITVTMNGNELNVEVCLKVKYGASVNATSSMVQNKVYESIALMTGIKPKDITVNVVGFEI